MKYIAAIIAIVLVSSTLLQSKPKIAKPEAVASNITYYIDVGGPGLFFTVTANSEEKGKVIYRALYDRFTKEQGFDISITYEERSGGFMDTARWQ